MNRTFALYIFCAICLCVPLAAWAAPITVPPDLNVGDKYRLAFVTSTARDAYSTDIEDYNDFVTAAAESVPELLALGTTWRAIASTNLVDARDNTSTNPYVAIGHPIYLLQSFTRVADNNSDLWDGSIARSIAIDEAGDVLSDASLVWTGTDVDGTGDAAAGFNTLGSVFAQSDVGVAETIVSPTTQKWIRFQVLGHESQITQEPRLLSLYAISGELMVVPEPAAVVLAGMGATALLGWQTRSRRNRTRQ